MRIARLWICLGAVSILVTGGIAAGEPASAAGTRTTAITINFDDVSAPCGFAQTGALRDEYASQGVHFAGMSARSGGGILNECGNFGVSGYSSPNFLAFNVAAAYELGGLATPPEVITFDPPVSSVEIHVGARFGAPVRILAYDASGRRVGGARGQLTSELFALTVTAQGIASVTVNTNASDWVLDDLSAS